MGAEIMSERACANKAIEHESCVGCKNYLGGGCCRINLEAECGKGEHEAWEDK